MSNINSFSRVVHRFCCRLGYQEETVLEAMVICCVQCYMLDKAVEICWCVHGSDPVCVCLNDCMICSFPII